MELVEPHAQVDTMETQRQAPVPNVTLLVPHALPEILDLVEDVMKDSS